MVLPKFLFIIFFSTLILVGAIGQVDYTGYNKILSDNVSASGQVDYTSIIKNDKTELNTFIKQLASVDPENLDRDEQLAYWINVYNVFTIKLVIDHWPVKSIKDISNGNPWDEKWITLNGKTYSLNQIENDIIRPLYQDPRIHFAVNCAAVSCPPLLNEPYKGDRLDNQLDRQTRKFLTNPRFNKLTKNSISISKLFDWYKEDFGDVINFINKYGETTINSNATIRYKEYNWKLNN